MDRIAALERQSPLLLGSICAVAVVIIDQISKWVVIRELGPDAGRGVVIVIPGVLRLFWVRNTGSAFGLFQGGSDILKYLALAGILVLAGYYLRAAREDWIIALALGLLVGGAVGNLVDRFRHGYVVDWIDLARWPTFNLADSAITVGVVLLMYAMLFRSQSAAPTTPETVRSPTVGVDGAER
jgi:signal peptidase II